jgi:hypothetical protein
MIFPSDMKMYTFPAFRCEKQFKLKVKSLFSCVATSSFCLFRRAISDISLDNKKVP